MPGGDRTGPMSRGPRTGGGRGYCNGFNSPGYANQPTMGSFASRRGGRGWRHRYFATGVPGNVALTPDQESANLKARAEWLRSELESVQQQIKAQSSEDDKKE